ncbi:4-hydroxyphenylpyruvate dioxygenase [Streptomyces sp. SID9727]|uniref:4-hydroxyphenylpyruvate dioxygenase n=1 Tax=Streptomyces sp. SID9727 TaxID=2706114 RepID=UPI0013C6D29D|nr:4-hydroxyphenylpyruvate dioxygenase [Streptomyces sp. SID9727]
MSGFPVYGDLGIEYVELYVDDLGESTAAWVEQYAFQVVAREVSAGKDLRSVALAQGDITLVLTESGAEDHPLSAYTRRHGSGVADIALRVPDVSKAFAEATGRGARPVAAPAPHPAGGETATVGGFGDVVHTFVPEHGGAGPTLPWGLVADPSALAVARAHTQPVGLLEIDHFAVCVDAGELQSTVDHYCQVLGFEAIFEEHIVIGAQAMNSKVVQSSSGTVTFTVIEPDTTAEPGQIDEFLARHGGAGVQHIAFSVEDAVRSVGALDARGVDFLTTPGSYYDLLGERLSPKNHPMKDLRAWNLLVDEDHAGQLFQIFTRSSHPRRTLFFEIIERLGAETFGSSNIKALYEAVELERSKQGGSTQ